jgi:glycosyltransferase involved in cell wall biosynthesis
LLQSKAALERAGQEVFLYDPWNPQFDEVDMVHYFSVQGGSMNFCDHVKRKGLPLVISPILWLTEENVGSLPMDEIRDLLHLCDRILPNSEAEKNLLAEFFHLSREKFAVIPNGVNRIPRTSGGLFRSHSHIPDPFLLNVANVEPRKNHLALIEAVREVGMRLVLLGHVRDQAYFQECLTRGSGFVSYLGYLEHDGALLQSAYAACEAFILPSLLETPGLSALEAGAQGARVVVTSVGSTREYFQDLAFYVNPHDAEDIRRGIRSALVAPKDDRLRDHILEHFTWDQTGRRLLDAYGLVSHPS